MEAESRHVSTHVSNECKSKLENSCFDLELLASTFNYILRTSGIDIALRLSLFIIYYFAEYQEWLRAPALL